MDELLNDSKLESHYGLNIIDAEIEDTDEHLIDAEQIEPWFLKTNQIKFFEAINT